MGIGSTIKDALKSDSRRLSMSGSSTSAKSSNDVERRTSLATNFSPASNMDTGTKATESQLRPSSDKEAGAIENSQHGSALGTDSYILPSGTGPGTTGKPGTPTDQANIAKQVQDTTNSDVVTDGTKLDNGVTGHHGGHIDASSTDAMPSKRTSEDVMQLNSVTHEHVRHVETEEVQRVKEHERHIHHVQHHTQPVVASNVLEEKHHENVHPVAHIRENHVNKPEEATLLEGQMRQHHDTVHHAAKERTVIDKGMIVNEHVHHHVHHVIQPIIQKETVDQHRIHTTIPIYQVTHEAPVIHQSRSHDPVPIEHFLNHGGSLNNEVQPEDVNTVLLARGQCAREVNGTAEKLEKGLRLDDDNVCAQLLQVYTISQFYLDILQRHSDQ
ncbi:hypothetical protein F5887DRAFT_959287 [Amanita rubescens]|nr:hypothetical protein F5887DRAFT_981879 [Amanita rubescens]KAF8346491.1 hypothetical protein F5887DRAFT_959287 [Amanita rubescens]